MLNRRSHVGDGATALLLALILGAASCSSDGNSTRDTKHPAETDDGQTQRGHDKSSLTKVCVFYARVNDEAEKAKTRADGLEVLKNAAPKLAVLTDAAPRQVADDLATIRSAAREALSSNNLEPMSEAAVVSAGANLAHACRT